MIDAGTDVLSFALKERARWQLPMRTPYEWHGLEVMILPGPS